MKKINLLGATGSIGQQTLDVVRSHSDKMSIVALSAGKNLVALREAIEEFRPKLVSVQSQADAQILQAENPSLQVVYGDEGLREVACFSEGEIVVNAVMGSVGLGPTLDAIAAGKDIGLANKETLVTAGHLVTAAAKKAGVKLLPIDSEHSAIFQCLEGNRREDITRIILTASGGSFRHLTRAELIDVTVEEALNHPNWSMGAKITIDCATMMNKGLEVIEAHWFFDLPYEQIDVLMHPESIVHSMVEYHDSSVIAQLGTPDMRTPIQLALSYPERLPLASKKRLNLAEAATLNFRAVDFERFPCVRMAFEAGKAGGTMPTVLNAANEVAVDLFLKREVPFLAIEKLVEDELNHHQVIPFPDLETITAVDKETRARVYAQSK